MIIMFLVIEYNHLWYCVSISAMFIYQNFGRWTLKYILSLLFKVNNTFGIITYFNRFCMV
jgi:hypothetical protein